ncbi:SMP-30/gluconolactonase/LRE family protein [Trujillonella endophytica]|uniref:Sugar lactone lactonase YvrE n=1 Tax=Trujillonella endophytica TaxID=673521 RepID=A0A1H8Q6R8_9ACTN|nr:SMP-30/gluconolactonase/LRE family protein [Trujillella endophytica]SEO49607.1 Sugar lactone lactonase YvrE [Trujillella endophytica]
MASRQLRTVLEGGRFFEAPRWHEGAWWTSDFYRHGVYRVTPDGEATRVVEVEGQPSGLGWLPDGSLLISSMKDRRVLRLADGELTTHCDLSGHAIGDLNDMVVDANGHAFVGEFGRLGATPAEDTLVTLKRVAPDGTYSPAAEGLHFPNGMAVSADGRTLLVGESRGRRYSAFDLAADGTLSNRRFWAELDEGQVPGQTRVVPDGCTLDAEGHLWVADTLSDRFVRLAPGGRIVEEIALSDGLHSYACALGGEDGRTLLLAVGRTHGPEARDGDAMLLATEVEVPHAGLP